MKIIYILFKYTFDVKIGLSDCEVIGVFTSLTRTKKIKDSLPPESHSIFYDIMKVPLNKVLDDLKPTIGEQIETTLEKMVKNDLLDVLIGEDGEFYFYATEKGKAFIKKRKKDKK